jgi:type IV pilus assembly protein PilA
MVVVLIIAILIAIAIPTFLGAKKRAQDKQAQSNLRNALTAEKTVYVDSQKYVDNSGTPPALTNVEPNLNYASADASARGVEVDQLDTNGTWVVLKSLSKSGTMFCLQDIASGTSAGTYYAKVASATATTACPTGGSTTNWFADAGSGW